MINRDLKPQNLPEKLIWYYIILTYPIYYLGGQYVLAPLLGYFLAFYLLKQWWRQTPLTPAESRIVIPAAVWFWIAGILVIEIALIVGHLNFDLSWSKIISSTVNRWLRTWALFPIFMLVGSLKIRPQIIYRAVCIFCIQSIFMAISASILRMSEVGYTSPLSVFGGGDFYDVAVFGSLLDNGSEVRLVLFAPWSPALGLVANVYFFLCWQEKKSTLRWLGMLGAVFMIVGSVSRLAIICLPLTLGSTWFLMNIYRPQLQLGTGMFAFLGGFFAPVIVSNLQLAKEKIGSARPGSSHIRNVLGRIALDRWQRDAFFWGHGTLGEYGPKATGYIAIGTHHTWYSVLYTHGLIGCLSLAIPLFWSLIDLVLKAHNSPTARVGLNIVLILIVFSVGENIDGLTYLYWPGLVILGIAFKGYISPVIDKSRPISTHNLLKIGAN